MINDFFRYKRILFIQEYGRTCASRLRYLRMKSGFIILQKRFKIYFEKKKKKDLADFELEKVLAEKRRLNNAARKIQYNMKACLFNYEMSKYILVCCIHYRTEYDLHTWHATILQKRWRGFMVRLKNKRRKLQEILVQKSATRIQSLARRRYIIKQYIPYRDYMRTLFSRWGRLARGARRVHLILGAFARKIQKAYRRFVYTSYLSRAAIQIQRIFRGHYYRWVYHDTIYAKEIEAVNKIKYCFKLYKCRHMRYAMWARMHMAAYKIEVSVCHRAFIKFPENKIYILHRLWCGTTSTTKEYNAKEFKKRSADRRKTQKGRKSLQRFVESRFNGTLFKISFNRAFSLFKTLHFIIANYYLNKCSTFSYANQKLNSLNFYFFEIKAAENRRQAAIARRVVSLQRRVRLWLERRRELKKQQQKELEEQMLKDALEAEEEEAVINERSYLFTVIFPCWTDLLLYTVKHCIFRFSGYELSI